MAAEIVLIVSHYGPPPRPFEGEIAAGRVRAVRQSRLVDADIETARGLVTSMHLDQVDFAARRPAIERFLARGGRIAFNGHPVLPLVEGIRPFVPLARPTRRSYDLVRLAHHPIFGALDPADMVERKGVAGFYGRGHAPMPEGAVALTGIGPERWPVDWVWHRPEGGAIFVHAGNELWTLADGAEADALCARTVGWCLSREAMEAAA